MKKKFRKMESVRIRQQRKYIACKDDNCERHLRGFKDYNKTNEKKFKKYIFF